jgi:uncharacterized protein YbjT (DUF2867 family)
MSSTVKTIAVVGATGAQGGGLVRAILNDPKKRFRARALTRNPDSESAIGLSEFGVEVVKADLDSLKSIKRAFDGAYGAYCVTNYWEHLSPERELTQASHMAEAARDAGLQHVIWSTLEDTRKWIPLGDERMPTLMGRYKVPHFDAKGEANRKFADRGVPVTFLLTSFYWDNLVHLGMEPKRGKDGVLALTLPMGDKALPGMAAADIGKCAFGIFRRGKDYVGKTVGVAGEHLTGKQMAAALGKALGEPVRYEAVEPAVYRAFGFPGADDLGNMFQFNRDFSSYFCGVRNLEESRSLNPELMDFATWLARNKNRIPVDKAAA